VKGPWQQWLDSFPFFLKDPQIRERATWRFGALKVLQNGSDPSSLQLGLDEATWEVITFDTWPELLALWEEQAPTTQTNV